MFHGAEIIPASELDIENAFSPEDLQPADDYALAVQEEATEIGCTTKDFLKQRNCEAQVSPVLLRQYAVSIVRSRQSDMRIPEYGEVIANISLGYIAQASSLWGQIAGAANGKGVRTDENDSGDAACSDWQADTLRK